MPQKHFILFYDGAPGYEEKRKPYRAEHLEHARRAKERGELVLAGAFADPIDGAALVFKGDSDQAARDFANADPYVINGVVKSWRIREWTTVIGELALTTV